MGKRRKSGPKTVWSDSSGAALVGKNITVTWPTDNTRYPALVLEYLPRQRFHKIIYHGEESIETLDLGTGPGQRDFELATPSDDKLIGADVVFYDRESTREEWFHFMRAEHEQVGDPFVVKVLAALDAVDPEEVSGPRKPDAKSHTYYRVVYPPNEYLATVDFAQIDYQVADADPAPAPEPQSEPAALADDPDDEAPDAAARTPDADAAYEPPANLDDDDDDSDHPAEHTEPRTAPDRPSARGKAVAADPALAHDEYDNDNDIDIDKVAKVVSADRLVEQENDRAHPATNINLHDDDAFGSLSPRQNEGLRAVGEGSIGTQETRDDPLDRAGVKERKRRPPPPKPSSLFPEPFDDEEGNETASADEEKLGWVSKSRGKKEGSNSQIGDYILVNTGVGTPRKAFVEAYLPETGTHFIAFCDTRGGNLQIRLTKENHRVLGDEEVDKLNRSETKQASEAVTLSSGGEEEVAPRKAKRRARSPLRTKKTRKRTQRAPEIKGQAADSKICGRCISIVWPVENLVYVALVLGYSSHSKEHQIVYMVDHCVETLDLRYREWTLLPREKEPWISTGMVGKRLYVFWEGSYDDEESQKVAEDKFGENTRVPYEAYVLSYVGDGKYKIIYTATEDTETRELKVEDSAQELSSIQKEWDLLDENDRDVDGLPLIGWTD